MRRATVVIADRQPVLLHGLKVLLCSEAGFDVVASCVDARNCLKAMLTLSPDVAIVDAAMPDIARLMNEVEELPTRVVLFVTSEDCDLVPCVRTRHRVLLKEMPAQVLVQCLRKIVDGEPFDSIPSGHLTQSLAHAGNAENTLSTFSVLTEREREIMRFVSCGLSNKEIGRPEPVITRGNIANTTFSRFPYSDIRLQH